MICAECQKIYKPDPALLGKIESLSGVCSNCLGVPRYLPFARKFAEGAIAGLVTVELALLILLSQSWLFGISVALAVVVLVTAVYIFGKRSEPVQYTSPEHRQTATRNQRFSGAVLGFIVGISAFLILLISVK